MGDHLDVPLEDAALLEEVELISSLMIAASESEGHLDGNEVDRLLGIDSATTSPTTGPSAGPATDDADAEERPPS